jgi:hypothetical protein
MKVPGGVASAALPTPIERACIPGGRADEFAKRLFFEGSAAAPGLVGA